MCACASHLMTQVVGSSGADVSVWLKEDNLGSHAAAVCVAAPADCVTSSPT